MTSHENEIQNPIPSETSHDPVVQGAVGQPPTDPQRPVEPKSRTQRNAPLLIGAGAAAAVLLLGGGGIAIGAALADNDGDDVAASSEAPRASEERDLDDDRTDPATDAEEVREADAGSGLGSASGTERASSDAQSLTEAIDAAIAQASGEGATSIEVERGGWVVDVGLADGTEVEVSVTDDGTATLRENDPERTTDPLIVTSKLSSIIDSAIDAAGGGTVESISTDNDRTRYEVSVDLGNGEDVDVEFDEQLAVFGVD